MPSRNDLVWRRLLAFAAVMAVGWAAALLYHFVMDGALRWPYPWSTFLFDPSDRFGDLIVSRRQARTLHPYTAGDTAIAAYFPAVYAALLVLRRASGTWLVVIYLVAALGASLALAIGWIRRERARWEGDPRWPAVAAVVLAVCLANYPLLMALDRGNFDPIIVALLAAAVVSLHEGRPGVGGVLLGVSAAAKGYPLAAALLWLKRGRPAGAAVAAATFAALLVLPGLLFQGGIAGTLRGLAAGLGDFRRLYVLGEGSAHFSADGLNAIRVAILATGRVPDAALLVRAWEPVAALWAALLCACALVFARSAWREALALALVMLVFPNVTNDYKLTLLVPVVLAWLSSAEDLGWRDRLFGACAALLLVPKHYGVLVYDASVSCLVSPLLLAGLTGVLWPTADERAAARAALARWRAGVGIATTAASEGHR